MFFIKKNKDTAFAPLNVISILMQPLYILFVNAYAKINKNTYPQRTFCLQHLQDQR